MVSQLASQELQPWSVGWSFHAPCMISLPFPLFSCVFSFPLLFLSPSSLPSPSSLVLFFLFSRYSFALLSLFFCGSLLLRVLVFCDCYDSCSYALFPFCFLFFCFSFFTISEFSYFLLGRASSLLHVYFDIAGYPPTSSSFPLR